MFKSHMRDITGNDALVEVKSTKLNVARAIHDLLTALYKEKIKLQVGFLKSPEESYEKLAVDAYYLELKKLTTLQDEIQIAYKEYSV